MKQISFMQVLILLVGAVLGSLIARMTQNISFLSWLSFGDTFGVSPFTVNLGVAQFTFGMTFNLTIAAILGLIIAMIICRWMR